MARSVVIAFFLLGLMVISALGQTNSTSAPTTTSTPTTAGPTTATTAGPTTTSTPTTAGPTTATTAGPTTVTTAGPTTTSTPTTAGPTTATTAGPTSTPTTAGPTTISTAGPTTARPTNPQQNYTLSYNSFTIPEIELPCPKLPGHCPRTWNYSTADSWGCACPEWSTCSSGLSQSPIDVFQPSHGHHCRDLSYKTCSKLQNGTCIFNTGNFFVTPVDSASALRFEYNGHAYQLNRVEFHTPAQHLLNGYQYDLEVNYYFASPLSLGRELATAVFYDRPDNTTDPHPATSPFLEQFVYELPEFSDCSCGNGKIENVTLSNPSLFWGINETCDGDGYNSAASGSGACCRPNCVRAYCGDGIVDPTELCDNGTFNSNSTPNACRLNCCLPACGDGVIDSGEECDDGNNQNGDGCDSICLDECGDGILNPALEQCDNGDLNSDTVPNACRTYCRLPVCGDGVLDSGEQCDNGTWVGTDPSQCRLNCTLPYCGDGITDNNEGCDDGTNTTYSCTTSCTSTCGNGVVEAGEQCDDGSLNSNAPDARCRSNCLLARCGDGIVDYGNGEQCDSVELIDPYASTAAYCTNIYCSANCTQLCGNGLPDPGEECDHGCYNTELPNRCRPNCVRPKCGDGIVDLNEECDWAGRNANIRDTCRTNCTVPKCGDGILDSGESCDDNNRLPGDGCDPNCRRECGNGYLEKGEECDYGADNANIPNNCRLNCRLPVCGDGILDELEECDNGALNSNSTPNACRLNCRLPYCGDNIIDWGYGEKCDFGANNSDTEYNGCSLFCIPNYCRQRCFNDSVDWSIGLPHNHTAYTYQGSRGYPPCDESIDWLLFSEVRHLSNFQYQVFAGQPHGLFGARPVQSINKRTVQRPCIPGPSICGNGIQESGEQCDLGFLLNSDWQANRCRKDCKLPYCGDGITDRGEECDEGDWAVNSTRCSTTCRLYPRYHNPWVVTKWDFHDSCRWHWHSNEWSTCAGDRKGAIQSPINIDTTHRSFSWNGTPSWNIPFTYSNSSFRSVWTGKQLALVLDSSSDSFTWEGKSYSFSRVEFYSPSEHTVNGYHADVEADFVHTSGNHSVVVVALFNRTWYNSHERNDFISQFEFYLPIDHECRFQNGRVEPIIGEECDDAYWNSDSKPDHCRVRGHLPRVGDGIVDRGEQCDDGDERNSYKPGHCRPTGLLPYCGDGIRDPHEECDFNDPTQTNLTCTYQCRLRCGNGEIDEGEQCDNGTWHNNNRHPGPWQCRTNCTLPHCGDGVCDPNEECDDGIYNSNVTSGACRLNCRLPTCGDGVADYSNGEECDNGALNGPNGACLSNCQLNCGSGIPGAGKQCDDGPMNSNTDGRCRTNCVLPFCGDGIVDTSLGEQCDYGHSNSTNVNGCFNCKILCGNGIVDAGEECDLGTWNDDVIPNTCRTTCRWATCNDGVKDWDEECDFGTQNSRFADAPCRPDCTLPHCGDKVIDILAGEDCDDGNHISGDGCSATCHWECGNGRRDANEECDDGLFNSASANSCRPLGFTVGGVSRGCTLPRCGDGIIDHGEQCDDGNSNGNLPNACRKDCTLPYCGDGIVDRYYNESCDLGVNNDDWSGSCSESCTMNACTNSVPPSGRFINPSVLFTRSRSPLAVYSGSLPYPPCTESVTYIVATKTFPISYHQYWEIHSRVGGRRRPVQPLNERTVKPLSTTGPVCGNCIHEAGEECDLGENNHDWRGECRTNCTKPRCGDGILDHDEHCDWGHRNGAHDSSCDAKCRHVTTCPVSPCSKASGCPSCVRQGWEWEKPTRCSAENSGVVNNSGTIINVNFAGLLSGAGCKGPNCA